MKKHILVMFGGISPEHEVSVITGLQIIEAIDKTIYEPHALYFDKKGTPFYIPSLNNRKQFLSIKRKNVSFGRDANGGYINISGIINNKIYPYAAYLGFHGGLGEGGAIQGMLETLGIAYTSPSQEASVVAMNKQLTKEQVTAAGINVVSGKNIFAEDIRLNSNNISQSLIEELNLPLIIKPVHLGSSIGIKVARSQVELEKYLLEAAFIDREVLVEKFLNDFVEYNCSVRLVNDQVETSEIEKPKSKDEILSFADKYQRGGKKVGGSGMASLARELPAAIPLELKTQIQEAAKRAFIACRCKGMVRIDFMHTKNGDLYLTEINPIPGSMAFYLWEATGIAFKQQISDLIEQSVKDLQSMRSAEMDYRTDIIEKFVAS